MRLFLAALVATAAIAAAALVFAIWPMVADAPWEEDAEPNRLSCDALRDYTESVIAAGPFDRFDNPDGISDYTATVKSTQETMRNQGCID